jgi:integrase/recombinase XerD
MSTLRQALQDYLEVRRSLGYKLKREGRLLPEFLDHVEGSGSPFITTSVALAWAMRPAGATSNWWATRLCCVRGFARYAHALDPSNQVPPPDLFPRRSSRLTPYLYSDEEIEALMKATCILHEPIKPSTYATLIGLLATTGLRIGEAIALDQTDVDDADGLLVVRHGKFGKSRLLPLHPTVQAALQAYACKRDQIFPHPKSPAFFVSSAGTRLFYSNVQNAFARLLERTGVGEGACRQPRIHDVRHTFAVKTLLDWYRQELDVDAWIPRLSTYLGHVSPASTYWYLTATPELVSLAAQRVERLGGTP